MEPNNDQLKKIFGSNLKARILENGMTYEQAAEKLGITVRCLQEFLYGQNEPSLIILKKASEELGADDLYLFISKQCA